MATAAWKRPGSPIGKKGPRKAHPKYEINDAMHGVASKCSRSMPEPQSSNATHGKSSVAGNVRLPNRASLCARRFDDLYSVEHFEGRAMFIVKIPPSLGVMTTSPDLPNLKAPSTVSSAPGRAEPLRRNSLRIPRRPCSHD